MSQICNVIIARATVLDDVHFRVWKIPRWLLPVCLVQAVFVVPPLGGIEAATKPQVLVKTVLRTTRIS